MKYYMGMDHGTTAVSFEIINENKEEIAYLTFPRNELSENKISFKDTINETINIKQIELLAMTYSMGDAINKITPINQAPDKGILDITGAGKVTGGGTTIYNEIKELNIPTILIPGLHKDCEFLDKRFRASYSHCASAEKVSLTYYAYQKTGWKNMIIADISSNTVCILVENGKIKGAIDACIGAMGFIHGPLDLSMIRKIDNQEKTANQCFSHAGISKIAKVNSKINNIKEDIINKAVQKDEDALLAIESLVMSVTMEIYGLYGIMEEKIDGIIITGSGGTMTTPININQKIKNKIEKIAPVKTLTTKSGALGSAYIAYDISKNKKNKIMGIEVK